MEYLLVFLNIFFIKFSFLHRRFWNSWSIHRHFLDCVAVMNEGFHFSLKFLVASVLASKNSTINIRQVITLTILLNSWLLLMSYYRFFPPKSLDKWLYYLQTMPVYCFRKHFFPESYKNLIVLIREFLIQDILIFLKHNNIWNVLKDHIYCDFSIPVRKTGILELHLTKM